MSHSSSKVFETKTQKVVTFGVVTSNPCKESIMEQKPYVQPEFEVEKLEPEAFCYDTVLLSGDEPVQPQYSGSSVESLGIIGKPYTQ